MEKEKLTVDSVKNFETEVDYTTVLDNFEGPLDLLLYLIKQEECNDELLDEEYSRFVENAESLGKCLNNVESVVKVDDVDRKIAVAKQKLAFLNNQNFLNDGYYELLIGWIEELIREGKCPTDVSKIQKPKKLQLNGLHILLV